MATDPFADVDAGDGGRPSPKTWGKRAYADKSARELLNDVSAVIARERPDGVDDPDKPSLSECIRHAGGLDKEGNHPKADALTRLLGHGMTYREAVLWHWYAVAQFSFSDIHFAASGIGVGGDPGARRDDVADIVEVLKSAAEKHPDADPDDVPDS